MEGIKMYHELKEPKERKIKDLYNDEYIIPIYQRNYAWGESEVTQLIQDIVDSSRRNDSKEHINYYIGTLVVFEREQENKIVFETIDGQQRLTTLSILLSAIKNEYAYFITGLDESKDALDVSNLKSDWFKLKIEFESRVVSTETLKIIKENGRLDSLHGEHYNSEIRKAYEISIKALKKILKNDKEIIKAFCDYLFHYVVILRVSVPKDTNLNHYFEIMNSRGEQLEKHEILKEWCLYFIRSNKSLVHAFNLIWEACSNMEKYVQFGFKKDQRSKIFGHDWNSLNIRDMGELVDSLSGDDIKSTKSSALIELLKPESLVKLNEKKAQFLAAKSKDVDTSSERFPVINFPNFLLHVLMIQIGQKNAEFVKAKIALDDKRLLDFFRPFLKKEGKDNSNDKSIEFVEEFGFNLLKCRFLFDKYIIKREFIDGESNWSLKQLEHYVDKNNYRYLNSFERSNDNEGTNKSIRMLLAMFHVSSPTQNYKYWLNAALKYLFNEEIREITASAYKDYLEGVAKAFLLDHFLAVEGKRSDYLEILYTNDGKSKNTVIDQDLLDKGTDVENFIFNYLDYLLWSENRFKKNDRKDYTKFKFTFRSSVEHYYPQNPKVGDDLELAPGCVDNFGNLCLIDRSSNSMYSNNMPDVKLSSYKSRKNIDSIKQDIMMCITEQNKIDKKRDAKDYWGETEIKAHAKEMKKILLQNLYVE